MLRSRRIHRWLALLLLGWLLAGSLASWSHSAVHAGEGGHGDECASCQWTQHHAALMPAPATLLHTRLAESAPGNPPTGESVAETTRQARPRAPPLATA
jgi:hypothetical protein